MNFYDFFNCSFQKLINLLNDCSQPESDAQYLAITFPIIVIKSFALPSDATPTQAVSIKSINLFILSFCGTFVDGLTKSIVSFVFLSQARIIKSLPVEKIILALDEGVDIEHILLQCEKLKGGIFNNSKEIWCIYDNDHSVLPKGSKASPSDLGKENFEYLLNNRCFKKE